jgi:hypothetical protein
MEADMCGAPAVRAAFCVLVSLAALSAAHGSLRGQARAALAGDIALQTQYDTLVSLHSMRGHVVALIYGDQDGSSQMGAYVRAARERWPADSVPAPRVLQAADLRAVPGLLKGYARGRFRRPTSTGARRTPVLLDWGGDIARAFGAEPKLANVYVIGADGTLRWKHAGSGTPENTAAFLAALSAELGEVRQP